MSRKSSADHFSDRLLKGLASQYPDDPGHHLSLACSYEMKGKHDEAIKELREVLRLDPTKNTASDHTS